MKKVNVIFGIIAMMFFAIGFSSCEKDADIQKSENVFENTVNSDETDSLDENQLNKLLSQSNTRIEIGTGSVTPTSGYVYETNFDFEFESTNAAVASGSLSVYVVFSAPLGGSYTFLMDKYVTGTSTYCVLSKQLTQLGTYSFQFAIKVGTSSIQTFGDTYYVTVNGHSFSYTNTYPYDGQTTGSDDWGYRKGWCTSYVAWKVYEMWGSNASKPFHSGLGHAITWKNNLINLGYVCDQNPLPGDIVWIEPGYNGADSTYGHVGFVNQRTNSYIKYTHYSGNSYATKTVYLNNIGPRYFIHVQTKK